MSKDVLINEGSCYGYLIELYHQKKLTYRMNNKKLDYLLTIFALCYMKNDIEPFLLIKRNNKLMPNFEFPFDFDTDCIASFVPEDGIIDRNLIFDDYKSLPSYNAPLFNAWQHSTLLEQEKDLLKEIFYSFGNYSREELSKMMSDLSNSFSYLNKQGCYHLQKQSVLSYFNKESTFNNKIAKFINKCNIDKDFYVQDYDVEKIKDFLYYYLITENNVETIAKNISDIEVNPLISTLTIDYIKSNPDSVKKIINNLLEIYGPIRTLRLVGIYDKEIANFQKRFIYSEDRVKAFLKRTK